MSYFVATCHGIQKKIFYEPNITSIDKLKHEISVTFGIPENEFTLSYLDPEAEKIDIVDKLDFDYFYSVGKEEELQVEVTSEKAPVVKKDIPSEVNFDKPKSTPALELAKPVQPKEPEVVEPTNQDQSKKQPNLLVDIQSDIDKRLAESNIKTLNECLNESAVLLQLKEKINTIKQQTEKMFSEMKNELVKTKRKNSGIISRDIESNYVHLYVACNNCGLNPINGKRYKCVICKNFDLCEVCEENNFHSHHPMIRINESVKTGPYYQELADLIKLGLNDLKSNDQVMKKRILKGIFGDKITDDAIEVIMKSRLKKNVEELINEFYRLLQ